MTDTLAAVVGMAPNQVSIRDTNSSSYFRRMNYLKMLLSLLTKAIGVRKTES